MRSCIIGRCSNELETRTRLVDPVSPLCYIYERNKLVKYQERFGATKRVFACAGYDSPTSLLRVVLAARNSGADGIFVEVKSSSGCFPVSENLFFDVHTMVPGILIGFRFGNMLRDGVSNNVGALFGIPQEAFGVDLRERQAETVLALRHRQVKYSGLVFSEVPAWVPDPNYRNLTDEGRVQKFVDVLVTPFPPTADTPQNEGIRGAVRVQALRQLRDKYPTKGLALEGYFPDQVKTYLPLADCVLVDLFDYRGRVSKEFKEIVEITRSLNALQSSHTQGR